MTKSNWPDVSRRVASDSFSLKVGEAEFFPHKGEWVKFNARLSSRQVRDFTQFYVVGQELSKQANADTAKAMIEMLPPIWRALAEIVLDWSWHGPDGKPYPKPTDEAISNLTLEEISWLVQQAQAPGSSAEVPFTEPVTPL